MPNDNVNRSKNRSDNRADKKNNQQNYDHFTEEHQTLTNDKAADYVPSLNGFPKNES